MGIVHRWQSIRFGHVQRMAEQIIVKHKLKWHPEGGRRPGRPKNSWREGIDAELKQGDSKVMYGGPGINGDWNQKTSEIRMNLQLPQTYGGKYASSGIISRFSCPIFSLIIQAEKWIYFRTFLNKLKHFETITYPTAVRKSGRIISATSPGNSTI